MFFAHRTTQWLRIVFAAGAAYAVLAYVVLELFGTWVLGRAFWQRKPSWARVLLLVTLIACCAVGAVFVSPFVVNCGPQN